MKPVEWNTLRVGGLIGAFAVEAAVAKIVVRDRDRRLRLITETASKYSKLGVRAMKVDVDVVGAERLSDSGRNFLIVSNHMSYLDILILSSIVPSIFVTSVDMGEQKGIGHLAELGGSIFVERRSRSQVSLDRSKIVRALRAGHNVVIYPEGTSTDGSRILPFKRGLLSAAPEAGVDIIPLVLKYEQIEGRPFGPENRDKVCWYGDMEFLPHFSQLTRLSGVKARLQFLEPLTFSATSDRDEIAAACFAAIDSSYRGAEPAKPDASKVCS